MRTHARLGFTGVAIAIAVVGAVTAPLTVKLANLDVHATTASPVTPPPVPSQISHQAWSLNLPTTARTVGAGAGLVVGLPNGRVNALDGRTGRVRWTYERDHTQLIDLESSPDGRLVAISLQPDGRSDAVEVEVMDALTGQRKRAFELPESTGQSVERTVLTSTELITQTAGNGTGDLSRTSLSGWSVATGRRLWRVPGPITPPSTYLLAGAPASNPLVLVSGQLLPGDTGSSGVEALNAITGRVEWTHLVPGDAEGGGALSPDNSLLEVYGTPAPVILSPTTGRPIGSPPGATVVGLLDDGRLLLREGTAEVSFDPGSGSSTPAPGPCWTQVSSNSLPVSPEDFGFSGTQYGPDGGVVNGDQLRSGPVCTTGPVSAQGTVTLTGGGLAGNPLELHVDPPNPRYASPGGGPGAVVFRIPGALIVTAPGFDPNIPTRLVAVR